MLERFRNEREKLKEADKEDKLHAHQLRQEKRLKKKAKLKRGTPDEDEDDDESNADRETVVKQPNKKSKVYFASDSDGNEGVQKAEKMS